MSNDSKYGRLYPERAVAPLFALIEGLLLKIVASPTAQRIEVELADLQAALNAHEDASFPVDEPLFLLRGQDVLAPETVIFYASLGDARNADLDLGHLKQFADRMAAWEPRKLPD